MQVTFHRAFDEVPDIDQALEDVIAAGCQRILTSGGAPDVLLGAEALARLVKRAHGRVLIAAGGGLRLSNVRAVRERTHVPHLHGSLTHAEADAGASLQDRVVSMMQILRES
jgi:copper homeostasis protein